MATGERGLTGQKSEVVANGETGLEGGQKMEVVAIGEVFCRLAKNFGREESGAPAVALSEKRRLTAESDVK